MRKFDRAINNLNLELIGNKFSQLTEESEYLEQEIEFSSDLIDETIKYRRKHKYHKSDFSSELVRKRDLEEQLYTCKSQIEICSKLMSHLEYHPWLRDTLGNSYFDLKYEYRTNGIPKNINCFYAGELDGYFDMKHGHLNFDSADFFIYCNRLPATIE